METALLKTRIKEWRARNNELKALMAQTFRNFRSGIAPHIQAIRDMRREATASIKNSEIFTDVNKKKRAIGTSLTKFIAKYNLRRGLTCRYFNYRMWNSINYDMKRSMRVRRI